LDNGVGEISMRSADEGKASDRSREGKPIHEGLLKKQATRTNKMDPKLGASDRGESSPEQPLAK
jgi:hypothetical protein